MWANVLGGFRRAEASNNSPYEYTDTNPTESNLFDRKTLAQHAFASAFTHLLAHLLHVICALSSMLRLDAKAWVLCMRSTSSALFHFIIILLLNFIDPSEYGYLLKTNQFRQESFDHINERPFFATSLKSKHSRMLVEKKTFLHTAQANVMHSAVFDLD